ncbi:MAG: quinolinate synthase NadA [candidate division KSB1 bacterium]|nr:quinolinate synthase NadA [candidate division KSB1 bacterium]
MDIMPQRYEELDSEQLVGRIKELKGRLGQDLLLLAHYYQRDEIVALADFVGDSYALAKRAAEHHTARFIVFCGVHFMAESARILCTPSQRVFLPDHLAGCPLAAMAELEDVQEAWQLIGQHCDLRHVVPVTYINSKAELKAFCGRNGGVVCTSTNAAAAMDWALARGQKVFFFPDQHLGRNVALAKGIRPHQIVLWDPADEQGGLHRQDIERAVIVLWNGHCHVHTWFTVEQVEAARRKYPGCRVVVHPECVHEVVAAADAVGSTSYIVKYVAGTPPGTTIVIGTEIHLVQRLAAQYTDRTVVPLGHSLCPNMYRINLRNLCWTLEELGSVNEITVAEPIRSEALIALERMLELR